MKHLEFVHRQWMEFLQNLIRLDHGQNLLDISQNHCLSFDGMRPLGKVAYGFIRDSTINMVN